MKILAVDDDDIALDLLGSALRHAGFMNLTTATSGAEALELIAEAEKPFDAFLLDIRMPGMNGIELCERIRSLATYADTPIIMITAMQERQYIEQAFLKGAIDYITKPFDPIELGVRVRLAEKLSTNTHQLDSTSNEIAYLKSRTGVGAQFAINEPITIRDIPRVISMTAMENYLLRLTYWMAVKSKSVVFSIAGFAAIHTQNSPADVYDILSDTAHAISNGLKQTNHIITYVGDGQFVAVVSGINSDIDHDTQWAIQSELDSNPPCLSTGRACPLRLEMGEVYSPGLWSAPNRLNLLLRPQAAGFQAAPRNLRPVAAPALSLSTRI